MDSHANQRVIDHGEVFTPPELVNDMLDLPGISDECLRLDARFLEPACGDGNFLAEVLHRRLNTVNKKHPKSELVPWERNALCGLANLYGIELLPDNVQACRNRLVDVFEDIYQSQFKSEARPEVVDAARHIVRCNILHGDALAKASQEGSTEEPSPLVFTEWSLLTGGLFKRRLFKFQDLIDELAGIDTSAEDYEPLFSDFGQPVHTPKPINDLPVIHYLRLAHEPVHGEHMQ